MPAATPNDHAYSIIYTALRELSVADAYDNDKVATRIVQTLDHSTHDGLRRLAKCLGITLMFAAEMAQARDAEAVVRSTARDADGGPDDSTTRMVDLDAESNGNG